MFARLATSTGHSPHLVGSRANRCRNRDHNRGASACPTSPPAEFLRRMTLRRFSGRPLALVARVQHLVLRHRMTRRNGWTRSRTVRLPGTGLPATATRPRSCRPRERPRAAPATATRPRSCRLREHRTGPTRGATTGPRHLRLHGRTARTRTHSRHRRTHLPPSRVTRATASSRATGSRVASRRATTRATPGRHLSRCRRRLAGTVETTHAAAVVPWLEPCWRGSRGSCSP